MQREVIMGCNVVEGGGIAAGESNYYKPQPMTYKVTNRMMF